MMPFSDDILSELVWVVENKGKHWLCWKSVSKVKRCGWIIDEPSTGSDAFYSLNANKFIIFISSRLIVLGLVGYFRGKRFKSLRTADDESSPAAMLCRQNQAYKHVWMGLKCGDSLFRFSLRRCQTFALSEDVDGEVIWIWSPFHWSPSNFGQNKRPRFR